MPTLNPLAPVSAPSFEAGPPIAELQSKTVETPKMMVRDLLRTMSEEATFEEILYEIETLAGIMRGIEEADAGKLIPHEEVLEQVKKWFSK